MSDIHIYDKAAWHFDGDYPDDLDESIAYTHAGFYLGWLILQRLVSDEFVSDFASEITRFRDRAISAPALFQAIDGVLSDNMLNDEGNRFSSEYFDFENGDYLSDYESLLADQLQSLYHAEDSWENFDIISRRLDERLKQWRRRSRHRWWKLGSR